MTTLIERIRNDRNQARKDGETDKVVLLGTLIGEIERNANKDASDTTVIANVKKFLGNYDLYDIKTPVLLKEMKIISLYLPRQMTREELISLKEEQAPENIKVWMAFLKTNYAGLYDGKVASQVFNG